MRFQAHLMNDFRRPHKTGNGPFHIYRPPSVQLAIFHRSGKWVFGPRVINRHHVHVRVESAAWLTVLKHTDQVDALTRKRFRDHPVFFFGDRNTACFKTEPVQFSFEDVHQFSVIFSGRDSRIHTNDFP